MFSQSSHFTISGGQLTSVRGGLVNSTTFEWSTSAEVTKCFSEDARLLWDSLAASDVLMRLANGVYHPDLWEPPPADEFEDIADDSEARAHIASLDIPAIESVSEPPMLLHQLGGLATSVKYRLKDIFGETHTFLINVSGSGKTRLLFEGLCVNWGLYFTSHLDSELLGSADMSAMIVDRLARHEEFTEFPSLLNDAKRGQALARNAEILHRRASCVLLVRLLVLNLFLERAMTHGATFEHRKFWLQAQLQPTQLVPDKEIFVEISEVVAESKVEDATIDDAISTAAQAIVSKLGRTTENIYIVLDEANVAASKYERSFQDSDGEYYPLLKALLQTWRRHLDGLPFKFVVAGTMIPREYFMGKEWKSFVWKSNVGGFDDVHVQSQYVKQFLSPGLQTSLGDSLVSRTWRWLRGRFTASYVSVLLEHNFSNPQAYLDIYVRQFTGYTPHDVSHKPPLPPRTLSYAPLDMFMLGADQHFCSLVHLALLDTLLFSEQQPGYSADCVQIVNESFGRFIDNNCQRIVIDEPLVVVAAVQWFMSENYDDEVSRSILQYKYFVNSIVHSTMLPRHPPAYLSFGLALIFGKSRRISDVFILSKPVPTWSRRNADIMVRKLDGGNVVEEPLRHVDRIPQKLVTYSTSLAHTLSWIRHYHQTPFCIHLADSTATLIFIVTLSNGSRFWAAMQILHSLADDNDAITKIRDTAHDLQPENLFRDPASFFFALSLCYDLLTHTFQDTGLPCTDILEALDALPNICPQVSPHGILPVIATIGKDVEPDSLNELGSARVALLKLDEISEALDLIPLEKVAERIIDAITKHSERADEELGVDKVEETRQTKPRAGKARSSASNPSRTKRPLRSSVGQHDVRSSGSDTGPLGSSRYNLRPRVKSKTR
uniref:Uncharacterized protein n=1 Tax=Moniliophthora roreri TaxID=221103 RepID=A0A0W0F2A2_MONRR